MGGLGARLRGLRVGLGLSQEALAEAVGVSARSINRWEQDHVQPQPEHRRRLAELFAIDPGDIAPTEPSASWFVPARRNPLFTGREAVLQHLREALAPIGPGPRVLALTGLPGIGKTQTAVEYAYRHADVHSSTVWLPADTREGCLAALAELAATLDLQIERDPDHQQTLAAIGRWFRDREAWLLILDNLADPALLEEVAPASRGSILVTTRAQAIGATAERVDLAPMSSAEGTRFLLLRGRVAVSRDPAGRAEQATAEILVRRLGGLPLALDQAGAYIEETGCGVYGYLDRFQTRQRALLGRRGRLARDHPESVEATLDLACRRAARSNPAAVELLRLCAFLHPDDIPLEILTTAATELGPVLGPVAADPLQLDEAIADLATLSLVRRDPRLDTLSVHRLVQDVVRGALPAGTEREWAERAVGAVAMTLPGSEPFRFSHTLRFISQGTTAIDLVDRWELRSTAAARLLDRMGAHHLLAGEHATSRGLLVRAWELRERLLGRDHLDTAETLTHLAELAFARGRYRRAETLGQAALDARQRQLGPSHTQVGNALGLLGNVHTERGHYARAEPMLERALAIQIEHLGPRHPLVAETLGRLARVPFMQGRYADAERLIRRGLLINEEALGPDHVVTGMTIEQLGTLHRYWGRNREAAIEFQRALAILSPVLGSGHPIVLTVLNGLARARLGLGEADEAEPLARRAMEIRERMIGPDHPALAFSLQCLSEILLAQGRVSEAETLAIRALAIRERKYGAEHQTVALSLDVLAQIQQRRGDVADAERLYRRALTTLDAAVGRDHPRAIPTLERYADLLDRAGRIEEGAAHRRRADAIRGRV
jgi:tetratricopeptide (TPR) repeat protein/transcriptional regulator with XRE-family HTH domain